MANKVLVIEDHEIVRENIAELLSLSDYDVITAADGALGIEMAKQHLPDIIVCDIMMPKFDGYQVLENLSKDTSTRDIPFIFLSAKTEKSDIRRGMNLGADDYLTKPFREEDLLNALESRLAKVSILKDGGKKGTESGPRSGITDFDGLKNYILDFSEEIVYKAGEVIYGEGKRADFVYLVYTGIVKTYRIDAQGKELITDVLKGDDFFGLTSLADNTQYQENAAALTEAKIYKWPKSSFKALLEENTALSLELINYVNSTLAETKRQLLQMAYSSVRKKTADSILKFVERVQKSDDGHIRISRSDLASVAGITTESFVRTLSEFKKSGIIETEGRNIKVVDLDQLRQIN